MPELEHPHRAIRLRREEPGDVEEISALAGAAFAQAAHSAPPVRAGGPPGEVDLLDWLRDDVGWLPDLALVAVSDAIGTRYQHQLIGELQAGGTRNRKRI